MRAVFILNNAALAMLQAGHHSFAIKQLNKALAMLRSGTDKDNNDCIIARTTSGFDAESVRSVPIALASSRIEDEAASPHNIFCFYDRAFELANDIPSPTIKGAENNSSACSTAVSSFLLFNLALTCHYTGLAVGNTSFFLRKALGVYKMILELLQDHPVLPDDHVKVLLMAIHSNMGHIHSHFFEDARSNSACIRTIMESSSNELSGALTKEEYAIFFLNATATKKNPCASAA